MEKMKPYSTKAEGPSEDVKINSHGPKPYATNEQSYRAIDNRLFKDDILPEKKPKAQ